MSGLDIEAIRARSDAAFEVGPATAGQVVTAAVLHSHWESAQDVPVLLAEIERLRAEVFTLTNSEDAMLTIVKVERDTARAALADALQVIADLRGGTS